MSNLARNFLPFLFMVPDKKVFNSRSSRLFGWEWNFQAKIRNETCLHRNILICMHSEIQFHLTRHLANGKNLELLVACHSEPHLNGKLLFNMVKVNVRKKQLLANKQNAALEKLCLRFYFWPFSVVSVQQNSVCVTKLLKKSMLSCKIFLFRVKKLSPEVFDISFLLPAFSSHISIGETNR